MHRTLNHILWGDRIWLSRFKGEAYAVRAFGADMFADFAELARERAATDTAILDWAGNFRPRGSPGRSNTGPPPMASCATWRIGSLPRTCSSTPRIIAGSWRR